MKIANFYVEYTTDGGIIVYMTIKDNKLCMTVQHPPSNVNETVEILLLPRDLLALDEYIKKHLMQHMLFAINDESFDKIMQMDGIPKCFSHRNANDAYTLYLLEHKELIR